MFVSQTSQVASEAVLNSAATGLTSTKRKQELMNNIIKLFFGKQCFYASNIQDSLQVQQFVEWKPVCTLITSNAEAITCSAKVMHNLILAIKTTEDDASG